MTRTFLPSSLGTASILVTLGGACAMGSSQFSGLADTATALPLVAEAIRTFHGRAGVNYVLA